jgi:hypothetical protein
MSFAIALAATLLLYVALRIGEEAAINGRLGPLPAIWAGDALLALVTLWVIARAPRLREGQAMTAYGSPSGSGEGALPTVHYVCPRGCLKGSFRVAPCRRVSSEHNDQPREVIDRLT